MNAFVKFLESLRWKIFWASMPIAAWLIAFACLFAAIMIVYQACYQCLKKQKSGVLEGFKLFGHFVIGFCCGLFILLDPFCNYTLYYGVRGFGYSFHPAVEVRTAMFVLFLCIVLFSTTQYAVDKAYKD